MEEFNEEDAVVVGGEIIFDWGGGCRRFGVGGRTKEELGETSWIRKIKLKRGLGKILVTIVDSLMDSPPNISRWDDDETIGSK